MGGWLGRNIITWLTGFGNITSSLKLYNTPFSNFMGSEALNSITLGYGMSITRLRLLMRVNSTTGVTKYTIRIGGVNTLATITVGAGATGMFDSGAILVPYTKGQTITLECDQTLSGNLNVQFTWFSDVVIYP